MVKKCLYCNEKINDESVVDFCESCGVNAFGPKMFEAIIQQMGDAKEKGNLTHQTTQKNPDSKVEEVF